MQNTSKTKRPAAFIPPAFARDIRRTIVGNLRIFLSIAVITALGVGVLIGLEAACDDLRQAADNYFDEQSLYDVSIQSTLGLDADDIKAIAKLEDVEVAEGGYTETAYTEVDGTPEKVDVKALSDEGLNQPKLVEGSLPEADDEVAVTQKYLNASGKEIGDTISFASDASLGEDSGTETQDVAETDDESEATDDANDDTDSDVFVRRTYRITGVVLDPMDVNPDSSTMTFRTATATKYAFFLTRDAVIDPSVYTIAYLRVKNAENMLCYSDEYEALIAKVKNAAEEIRDERENARTNTIKADATQEIDDAEAEVMDKLDVAQQQLDDAQETLDGSAAELTSGTSELNAQEAEAASQLAAAQAQIDDGRTQLDTALAGAYQQVEEQVKTQAEASIPSIVSSTLSNMTEYQQLSSLKDTFSQLQESQAQLQASIDALTAKGDTLSDAEKAQLESLKQQLATVTASLAAAETQAGMTADEVSAAMASIESAVTTSVTQEVEAALPAQIEAVKAQVYEANFKARYAQLDAAQAELDDSRSQAAVQIASARAQLADGQAELADGQAELDANQETFEQEKADALESIADARTEVDDIESATWYIQDRSSLSSYASLGSDADSIESIATVFPLIFFAVAALISSTTISRMVDEDRELIGLYKALGYRRGQILSKYLIYALAASLTGVTAGSLLGYVVLPAILFTVFSTMYDLPGFVFTANAVYVLVACALFSVGIVGSAILSCYRAFREVPALLMRPRAPRAGTRILLEHIGPLWRRLSFLNKVTARNLFRYKKRLLMTVAGIAGCSALMICGLGIRDTVSSFKTRQYGSSGVSRYDLLAVTTSDDLGRAIELLDEAAEVDDYLTCRIDSVTLEYAGSKESVQLMVVPDDADLSPYVNMNDEDGNTVALPTQTNAAVITINAKQVLGFSVGDTVSLQDSALRAGETTVSDVQINYLGNFVYMTQSAYKKAFGRTCKNNAFLVQLSGTSTQQINFADKLVDESVFVSISSTARLSAQFSESFKILDTVVVVLTIMAAALAFAVVFTLSTTNISERERELATIKVLGFRRPEVRRYINKETLILAGMGIVAGCPLGFGLVRFLSWVLHMPSLYFDTLVDPPTYVISSALSLVFVLVVNLITNRTLDRVDMVAALKSPE